MTALTGTITLSLGYLLADPGGTVPAVDGAIDISGLKVNN